MRLEPRTSRSVKAHAKVNLALRVRGTLPGGYHELWTVFDEIELHDTLTWHPAEALSLEVHAGAGSGLAVPSGDDNLVLRAVRAFEDHAKVEVVGRFDLHKRIPAGAGLGGGSSDAARVLRLLALEHGIEGGPVRLGRLAADLGADVPFFLTGGRAIGRGRGDLIEPVESKPGLHYCLLCPGLPIPTKDVFARWQRQLTGTGPVLHSARHAGAERPAHPEQDSEIDISHLIAGCLQDDGMLARTQGLFNDLEEAASVVCPALGRLRRRLIEEGLTEFRLSGSGSTLFFAAASPGIVAATAGRLSRLTHRWLDEGFDGVAAGARVVTTASHC